MDPDLEIAVSLASKALSFFIGTGFSKYITDDSAPSWPDLLVQLTLRIDDKRGTLLGKLFSYNDGNIVPKIELSICAQILDLEYRKRQKDIRIMVGEILGERINNSTINKAKVKIMKEFFRKYPSINIITTNYDTILSEYVLRRSAKVFVDGSQIPKSGIGQNIFHIHGCITRPSSLILTINDYFKFQHKDNYLSRKFYTLLQETTVVILGYSLGDFNLNRIFNEAQVNRSVSLRKSNIFLVSKEDIDQIYKDFYAFSYGIHVIDDMAIDDFIRGIEARMDEANALIAETENLLNVMNGGRYYTDNYIKLSTSFNNILLQASAINVSFEDRRLIRVLMEVLKKKKDFTHETDAWDQYTHLAEWLSDLGSLVDIEVHKIRDEYLELIDYSLRNMSRDQRLGYSWASYRIWKSRFQELTIKNRAIISEYIKKNFNTSSDAYDLI